MRRLSGLLALAVALAATSPSAAQIFSRQDLGTIASVRFVDCPGTTETRDALQAKAIDGLGLPLETFAAQVAGDTVSAAASALGAALEEASRARTYAVTGQGSFEFYVVSAARGEEPKLAPAFGEGGQCLEIKSSPENPELHILVELVGRPDGFLVRPRLINYANALEGAPQSRALPSELHLTFATPGQRTPESEIGAPFAVARIPLPPLQPGRNPFPSSAGDAAAAAGLWEGYSSTVLPLRPTTGTPGDFLTALVTAESQRRAQEQTVVQLERALDEARRAEDAGTPAGARAIRDADYALFDARALRDRLAARVATLAQHQGGLFGSTNVQARFVLVRDENAFLKAIGKSLQDRSASLGTGVSGALTPQGPEAAWTEKDTAYVAAMSLVSSREADLATAEASGDAAVVLAARIELIKARAAANEAAAASGRSLPYASIV